MNTKTERVRLANELFSIGVSYKEVSEQLGISIATAWNYWRESIHFQRSYKKAEESVDQKYGKLTCTSLVGTSAGNDQRALFDCDCGNTNLEYKLRSVKRGSRRSCGCLVGKSNLKHGYSRSKTYNSWNKMLQRVQPSFKQAKDYYERGISIEDPRWYHFMYFLDDMGECPKGLTLDRIDNDKGYYKENCRWATRKQQQSNRRCCKKAQLAAKSPSKSNEASEKRST